MQISPINGYNNQSFGHSFRVSICVKDADGLVRFINPSDEQKLYKNLNSKIVNWLNEDFYTNLRRICGLPRKSSRIKPETEKHRELVKNLMELDSDYSRLNLVRTQYRRNNLAYIATGTDVPIIENIKGAKQIGLAKTDAKLTYGDAHSNYVKALCKAVKYNVLDYVQHDNVLLRSPTHKERMLKVIFKPVGKQKSGVQRFELDDFEFHTNQTKRTLAPVNKNFIRFKQSEGVLKEIQKTIEYQMNKIMKRRVHFTDLNQVLYPKVDLPADKVVKTVEKPQPFIRKNPVQLEFDFKD